MCLRQTNKQAGSRQLVKATPISASNKTLKVSPTNQVFAICDFSSFMGEGEVRSEIKDKEWRDRGRERERERERERLIELIDGERWMEGLIVPGHLQFA